MKKRLFAILLAISMVFSLTGCVEVVYQQPQTQTPVQTQTPASQPAQTQTQTPSSNTSASSDQYKWAFYWYLCGSDLESRGGCATTDLQELLSVQLPEGVIFVIETGGAKKWNNNLMKAGKIQRWTYSSRGLEAVGEEQNANMGESETLFDFLEFAKNNYPAEKTGLIFWNHGGGSVAGAAFDEIYSYDSLNLNEMYAACGAALGADPENPPLEMVGFDTCLMATIDVAATFSDIAHYLVASEEVEPGGGWLYSGWASALAKNPDMNGAQLGKYICDSFAKGCQQDGTSDSITLSVVDLSKIDPLLDAYENFGAYALIGAAQNTNVITKMAKAASVSENYGGNTKTQGYTNMIDLSSFASNCSGFIDGTDEVQKALSDCVLYKINGRYKAQSGGLSCYYSFNNDKRDYNSYKGLISDQPYRSFSYITDWKVNGKLSNEGIQYVKDLLANGVGSSSAKPETPETPVESQTLKTIYDMNWDKVNVSLNKKTGTASINLGKEADDILSTVCFELFNVVTVGDKQMQVLMGFDNDVNADWQKGVFSDNFRGVWPAINGIPVYLELCYGTPEYSLYSVPILLNGEQYNLQVVYSFEAEEWQVMGARPGLDPSTGMSAKELKLLEAGDEISIIWKVGTNAQNDALQNYSVATVTVDQNTVFDEAPLPNGTYKYVFELTDTSGNVGISTPVTYDVQDGDITTTIQK